MPQTEGGGTVYTGGPGTSLRGPIYVKTYGNVAFPVGNGVGPTFNSLVNSSGLLTNQAGTALFDTNGNLINPSTGTIAWETNIVVPNASVLTLYSVGFPLIAAPGAGLLLEADALILNNIYKTGAFTAGGAIQLNYAAGAVTLPASATIAATFLTSPTANQIIKAAGSLASTLSSSCINAGLYLCAATQDFATGAGSLIATVRYRVRTAQ